MLRAESYAQRALSAVYDNYKYSDVDCQGFVEKVLSDAGVKKPDGKRYNWRGSNHIWREALSEKAEITDINDIPAGALVFTLVYDGGEKERGYNDNEGNAKHVGIYCGSGVVRHSTKNTSKDGVQSDRITSKRWTHFGLLSCLDYSLLNSDNNDIVNSLLSVCSELNKLINKLRKG